MRTVDTNSVLVMLWTVSAAAPSRRVWEFPRTTAISLFTVQRFLLLLLIAVFTSTIARGQETTFTVRVLDDYDGSPLAQANVELIESGNAIESATTDANGEASFTVTVTSTEQLYSFASQLGESFPNPASTLAIVPITLRRQGKVSATLYDLQGRVVVGQHGEVHPGESAIGVKLTGLSSGIYLLQVSFDGDLLGTRKIVLTSRSRSSAAPSLAFIAGKTLRSPSLSKGTLSTLSRREFSIRVTFPDRVEATESVMLPVQGPVVIRLVRVVEYTNPIGMEFVRIAAGTFEMGSDLVSDMERPVHAVTLTRDMYMSRYETTQGQYRAAMGTNLSYFTGDDNLPVDQAWWDDAIRFTNALSISEGYSSCYDDEGNVIGGAGGNPYLCEGYRLPTEAEWEYACRAGTSTEYFFGDDPGQLDDFAWHQGNSGGRTHTVGAKQSNAWGLFDMYGNVSEWVNDMFAYDFYKVSPSVDPYNDYAGGDHVFRGGSWFTSGRRSAFRGGLWFPDFNCHCYGFRVLRTAQ